MLFEIVTCCGTITLSFCACHHECAVTIPASHAAQHGGSNGMRASRASWCEGGGGRWGVYRVLEEGGDECMGR